MQEACVDRVQAYRRPPEQMPLDRIKDPLRLRRATLVRSLPVEDRETLLAFARQVAIDACSSACGALDSNTSLAGRFFEFSLLDEPQTVLACRAAELVQCVTRHGFEEGLACPPY